MARLNKITAVQCDELLSELINLTTGSYDIKLLNFIAISKKYNNVSVAEIKKLLHLIMVEQQREFIPQLLKGTDVITIMDGGLPIKDFLLGGGFTQIEIERRQKDSSESYKFWGNTLLVAITLIFTIYQTCGEKTKDRVQTQPEKQQQVMPKSELKDSTKRGDSKSYPKKKVFDSTKTASKLH